MLLHPRVQSLISSLWGPHGDQVVGLSILKTSLGDLRECLRASGYESGKLDSILHFLNFIKNVRARVYPVARLQISEATKILLQSDCLSDRSRKDFIVVKNLGGGTARVVNEVINTEDGKHLIRKEYLDSDYDLGMVAGGLFNAIRFQAGHHLTSCARLCGFGVNQKGNPFLLFEWIEGGNLDQNQHWFQNEEVILEEVLKLLKAFSETHQIGIVHRDISGNNILRSVSETYFFADYDMSLRSNECPHVSSEDHRTATYLPPESQEEDFKASFVTDVYAMGQVLESLIGDPTGRPAAALVYSSLISVACSKNPLTRFRDGMDMYQSACNTFL